jgi:PTS system ascorbate-specific IIC component
MVIMPAFSMPWMRKVTGGEKVAMGHFGTFGYIAGGVAGQLVGRGSKSTEEMQFPQGLRFLRDPMVGTAVAMIFIYLILAIIFVLRAGEATAVQAITDAGFAGATGAAGGFLGLMSTMFNQALVFGGGVAVILLGVRTILGEIVPAFAGIAERVIPGAVPALDCPVSFPYAPNAVLVGFLASVVGGLVGFAALLITDNIAPALAVTLILPGMIPHFFTGGTAGVFGNATGGRRGAVAGGFINGLIITIFAAILVPVMGGIGFQNTTFGDADFQWFGFLVGNIATYLDGNVAAAGIVVLCVVLLALASWFQRRYVDTNWIPGGSPTEAAPAAPEAHVPGAA